MKSVHDTLRFLGAFADRCGDDRCDTESGYDFGYVEYIVVAAILMLLAFWIFRRLRASRLSNRASDPAR